MDMIGHKHVGVDGNVIPYAIKFQSVYLGEVI